MSIRFDTSYYSVRTASNVLAAGSAWTAGGWLYVETRPSSGTFSTVFFFADGTGFEGIQLRVTSAGVLQLYNLGSSTTADGPTLNNGQWYYVWLTRASGTGSQLVSLFVDGSTTASATLSAVHSAVSKVVFGQREAAPFDEQFFGRVAGWKLWSVARAASNAATERNSNVLVSTTDAVSEWRMTGTTDLADTFGSFTLSNDISGGSAATAGEPPYGGTAPTISVQPANASVSAGATANFTVSASGSGTLTYQWQRSTDSGVSWNNVTTGTGGTTASYTTAATTVSGGNANNGDQYRVIVTGDTSPPATSTAATLTVTSGAPDAPNTLARTLNPGSVDLTWVLPGTGATRTGVRVERRNVTAAGAYSTLASLGASAVNYSDTTALGGILWRYRVIAFNGAGDSGPSNEVDANYTTGGGSTGGGNLFGGTLVRS